MKRTPSPLPGPPPPVIHETPLERQAGIGITTSNEAPQPVTNAVTSLQHALGYVLPAHLARAQDASNRIAGTVSRGR